MTKAQTSAAPKPTPQHLNTITAQLHDLNSAYKAAVAANGKAQGGSAAGTKHTK